MTKRPAFRSAVTSVLIVAMLAGTATTAGAQRADRNVSRAESALAKGEASKAISPAEAAVLAAPGDAARRALLGHAYLRAGRFASAATTFNDAMQLGDNSARTALALALANIGAGRSAEAVAVLDDWRDAIPASDRGLALALAGQSRRGVALLSDAIREGDNTPKARQNLAYAYALDGRWREARLMMAQDVPADQIGDRIAGWAATIQPDAASQRVAVLLGTPLRNDPGQPRELALAASPVTEQLAAEASAVPAAQPVTIAAAGAELPALAAPVPMAAANPVAQVDVAPAPIAPETGLAPVPVAVALAAPIRFVSQPVVQSLPQRIYATVAQAFGLQTAAPRRAAPVRAAAKPRQVASAGTHLVQLGSFASPQGARRAWGIYTARNPVLRDHRMVVTAAVVRGKNYWRVAAAGFNAGSAQGMCSNVKARGGVCFAYAAPRASSSRPMLAAR